MSGPPPAIGVGAEPDRKQVCLYVWRSPGDQIGDQPYSRHLTPERARKIAAALVKAADEAEREP